MNIAMVSAGGAGVRTGQSVPKQFLTVNEVPIIIHTLLNIKKSQAYDKTVVIIPDGWQTFMASYCRNYDLDVEEFIIGGETRLGSILNAVRYLDGKYNDTDVVSIIDANRPLIPASVFKENLRAIRELGDDAIVLSACPCVDSIFRFTEDGTQSVNRSEYFLGQTPETAYLKFLKQIYYQAEKDKVSDLAASGLALKYGKRVEKVAGSVKSFKITVSDDLNLFKALLRLNNEL